MTERKAVVRQMAVRYRRATKKDNELIDLTGYNRWYAVGLLNGAPMKAAVAPKRRVLTPTEF